MTTQLASQRNFVLASTPTSNQAVRGVSPAVVVTTQATTAAAPARPPALRRDHHTETTVATLTVSAATSQHLLATHDIKSEEAVAEHALPITAVALDSVIGQTLAAEAAASTEACSPASLNDTGGGGSGGDEIPEAQFEEFIQEEDDPSVVTTLHLEDVMTQKIVNDSQQTGAVEEVAVIGMVVPMDATDSAEVVADGVRCGRSMPSLGAIKDNVDLVQHVANGQLAILQNPSGESDEDGTPQYITVTVSAQDAGQNYQVQYVDTELYHSNSSQTQMSYPFCPVGDYQTNGQTYYSTGNYGTNPSGNTAASHAATLPYLVPVEESLLLNSSSQSHSRDSPHSMTEVSYLHEAQSQSTPQTPTSTTTTNSVNGSIGTGGGDASPECEQGAVANANKISSATIKWLSRNYETADGVSLPRSTLYNHYMRHCNESKLEPVNAASFGKLIRSVFSGLRTRRLGTRGNSKYHYYGIRIKPGSELTHDMDEKSGYSSGGQHQGHATHQSSHHQGGGGHSQHGCTTAGNAGGVSSSTPSGPSGSGLRSGKKHSLKPETYEACAQYLGDGAGAIPTFPHIEPDSTFSGELSSEDFETFRAMYREHCESFLDAVLNLEFNTVELLWRDFWRCADNNNSLDECEEEKYLSKSKLFLLCHCAEVQKFVKEVDYQFYQNMVDVIIPDVLRCIPNALTQAIRNFAKNLEIWLCESMVGVPEPLMQIKSSAVSAFCQTLRRYTSLNHLAQAARAVLQNSSQIAQMLSDLNRVDFHNVQEQAAWVCQCEPAVVQRLENDFKAALQQQSSLEQWATWLQLVVDSALQEYRGKPSYAKAARQFLLKWSFYSSMVIRDLTLRSASSFGSFHLIRLLYDEYMFYLVEHKIAEAQQKTAIAVICDRLQKDLDYDFEYQLEFITNSGRDSMHCSPAKRLKHE